MKIYKERSTIIKTRKNESFKEIVNLLNFFVSKSEKIINIDQKILISNLISTAFNNIHKSNLSVK
jgi:hypothetical protein